MSLQKFTKTQIKVNRILSMKKITIDVWNSLNKREKNIANNELVRMFNESKGAERDKILSKMESITGEQTKSQIWTINHIRINNSIVKLVQHLNRMPSKDEIAEESGLSRQTIHKHLSEYSEHPLFKEELIQYRFASNSLLSVIYKMAIQGDIKAAKLFFNVVGNDSIVEAEYCRDKEPEPFGFEIDGYGLPILSENWQVKTTKKTSAIGMDEIPPDQIYALVIQCFSKAKELGYSELVIQMKLAFKLRMKKAIGDNKAKEMIAHCKNEGWLIQKSAKGKYKIGAFSHE